MQSCTHKILGALFIVAGLACAASSYAQIDAFALRDLYAFREVDEKGDYTDKRRMVLLMTFGPHNKLLQLDDVFSPNAKYVFNIAKDIEPKINRVITAFTGSNGQYTVYFDDAHQIIAKLGRYGANGDFRAFLGVKADARFYDDQGFKKLLASPCKPVFGLRCSLTDFVENGFAGVNVGVFAATVPIEWLTGLENPEAGTVRIWGQVFKRIVEDYALSPDQNL